MQDYRYREAVCMVNSKIRVFHEDPYTPEVMANTQGTAFFVKTKEDGKVAIITCAHVVSCANLIHLELLQTNGEILRCTATIRKSLGCVDLALLELDPMHPNANLFQSEVTKRAILIYAGNKTLAELKSQDVIVCGYQLSKSALEQGETVGTIARFLIEKFAYSQYEFGVLSVTNRINGGFSGAPLIIDEDGARVLGVLHQGADQEDTDGESSVVPWFYLKLLLDGYEQESLLNLRGLGVLPAKYQKLESPDHREFLGMKPEQTGVRISHIPVNSIFMKLRDEQFQPHIKVGDILLKVNGRSISNQGNVFDDVLKIPLEFSIAAFNCVRLGSNIELEIGRPHILNGKNELVIRTIKVPNLQVHSDFQLIKERPYQLYFFAGGVTFCSPTRDMISYLSQDHNEEFAKFYKPFLHRKRKNQVNEIVVVQLAFNHPSLEQKRALACRPVVTHVNGFRIKNLYHLRQLITLSRELKEETFTIEVEGNEVYHLKHFTESMEAQIKQDRNLQEFPLSNLRSFLPSWQKLFNNLSTITGKRKPDVLAAEESTKTPAVENSKC